MPERNKIAMAIAIVAGMLMLVAGTSGAPTWEMIKRFVTTYVIDHYIVQIIFAALIGIASLGGISVIAGGLLIGKNRVLTGKFLIFLGAGMGLIGLIVSIVVAVTENPLGISRFTSTGGIGLILSIVARSIAK